MDTQYLCLQWWTHTVFSSQDPLQSLYNECDIFCFDQQNHEYFSLLYRTDSLWNTHAHTQTHTHTEPEDRGSMFLHNVGIFPRPHCFMFYNAEYHHYNSFWSVSLNHKSSDSKAPHFLNFGTSWQWIRNFILQEDKPT